MCSVCFSWVDLILKNREYRYLSSGSSKIGRKMKRTCGKLEKLSLIATLQEYHYYCIQEGEQGKKKIENRKVILHWTGCKINYFFYI